MKERLILVADSAKAQLLKGKGRKIHSIIDVFINKELNAHSLNNPHESLSQRMSMPCHAYDPHSAQKLLEKQMFAKLLGHEIQKQMSTGQFEDLVMVAEPKMLGLIRRTLRTKNHICIHKELSLDITDLSQEDLEDRIFS